MQRSGVRLSVPSGCSTLLLRVCCCGPTGQQISIDCCTAGAGQQMRAVSRVSRRRKLNTDLLRLDEGYGWVWKQFLGSGDVRRGLGKCRTSWTSLLIIHRLMQCARPVERRRLSFQLRRIAISYAISATPLALNVAVEPVDMTVRITVRPSCYWLL